MRSLIVGASLSIVAVVLQGCGGGGDTPPPGTGTTTPSPSPPGPEPPHPGVCLNDKINLVTQSVSGTMTGTVSGIPGLPMPSIPLNVPITEKVDLDQFNVRFDASMTLAPGMDMAAKAIFNAANKEFVFSYTMGGKTVCKKKSIPECPDPTALKLGWNSVVLPKLQESATCGGNDGTLDTWNVHESHDGPVPGVPGSADVTVTASLMMDKDYLIHEMHEKVSAKVTDPKPEDIEMDISVKYDSPTATGPTAADLDYSSWGTCDPMTVTNVDELFKLGDDSNSKVLEVIMQNSILRKVVTDSVQVSMKPKEKEVVKPKEKEVVV